MLQVTNKKKIKNLLKIDFLKFHIHGDMSNMYVEKN